MSGFDVGDYEPIHPTSSELLSVLQEPDRVAKSILRHILRCPACHGYLSRLSASADDLTTPPTDDTIQRLVKSGALDGSPQLANIGVKRGGIQFPVALPSELFWPAARREMNGENTDSLTSSGGWCAPTDTLYDYATADINSTRTAYMKLYGMNGENTVSNVDETIAEVLRERAEKHELDTKMELVDKYLEMETLFASGDVITFKKTLGEREYSFAAINASHKWYITGRITRSYSWTEFVQWLLSGVPVRQITMMVPVMTEKGVKSGLLDDNGE